MRALTYTGGAKLAWVGASWPFARLRVEPDQLTLSSLGRYAFGPEDIVALEPFGAIPLIGKGILIRHNRPDYPETLVFWCLGGRDRVLADILRVFTPAGAEAPRAPGIAIKWTVLLAAIVLWNLLLMMHPSGARGVFAALALMFVGATAMQRSLHLQQLVLRPGHQAGEMKPYLILMQIVSAFLLAAFGLQALTGPVSTSVV